MGAVKDASADISPHQQGPDGPPVLNYPARHSDRADKVTSKTAVAGEKDPGKAVT